MTLNFADLNWLGILASFVLGQLLLTVWFAALFKRPWAKEYGVADPKQHTQALPGYTYAVGAGCTLLLTVGLAALQQGLGVTGATEGLVLGAFVTLCFGVAIALPGYAFLKRYAAFWLALGAQAVVILSISLLLALWR